MTGMDEARAHILNLIGEGMTQRQIEYILGAQNAVISRALSGDRDLDPALIDQVMRVSAEDVDLSWRRAPTRQQQLEEEYQHFCVRLDWAEEDFAELMAPELGVAPATVLNRIWEIQRRRSAAGLSRPEHELLEEAAGLGEVTRAAAGLARRMEKAGLITTEVWRAKGHRRIASLTDEGWRRLLLARKDILCQS